MKKASTLAIITISTFASMTGTCAEEASIKNLLESAKSGFSTISDTQSLKRKITLINDAQTCQLANQLSGGKELVCFWQYEYRNSEAAEQFWRLNIEFQELAGTESPAVEDLDVNHPDYYDLKTYNTNDAMVSVSLKDKAALDQTFVFLRVSKSTAR